MVKLGRYVQPQIFLNFKKSNHLREQNMFVQMEASICLVNEVNLETRTNIIQAC